MNPTYIRSFFFCGAMAVSCLAHADYIEEPPAPSPAAVASSTAGEAKAMPYTANAPVASTATISAKVIKVPNQDSPGVQVDDVVIRSEPPTVETWVVSPTDITLRRVLAKWAARAGWQLSWEAAVDVPVTVSATFQGDFRKAIAQLFGSLSASDVNIIAMLYKGNRVIRVTESGQRAQ